MRTRFLACLDELARKGQRTVYRLTLVKGMNTTGLDDYARLVRTHARYRAILAYCDLLPSTQVARGRPDFIEIKGVTFCGSSNSGDDSEVPSCLAVYSNLCPERFHSVALTTWLRVQLTMQNVPWHEEVVQFGKTLCEKVRLCSMYVYPCGHYGHTRDSSGVPASDSSGGSGGPCVVVAAVP